jgi:hypothetical protein
MIRLPTRPIVLTAAGFVALAVGLQAVFGHGWHHHRHYTPPPEVKGTLDGIFRGASAGDGTVAQQEVTIQGHHLTGNIQLETDDGEIFPLSSFRGHLHNTRVSIHSTSEAGAHLCIHGTVAEDVLSVAFVLENADGTVADAGLMTLKLVQNPQTE